MRKRNRVAINKTDTLTKNVTIRFDQELHDWVIQQANKAERSISDYCRIELRKIKEKSK